MGKKDKCRDKKKKKKIKDECCEKYIKKGQHCKGCPVINQCDLPGE